jgi:hypothetical protein
MADMLFNGFKQYLADGTIDLKNDTIKCALFPDTYTPDEDGDDNWDDIDTEEVSGTGYSAGGVALSTKTVTHLDDSDKGVFDADDVTFEGVTLSDVKWAVLYKDAVSATDRKLIGAWDIGGPHSPVAQDFVVKWNTGGILNFS